VFGGAYDEAKYTREQAADVGAACMAEVLEIPQADKLNWVFETHDAWIAGDQAKMLIDRVNHPAFAVLWDTGHTYRITGEKPADTYAKVGRWVRYVHVKDAVYDTSHPKAMKDGWRYVQTGTGQLPLAESIAVLKKGGYTGYLLCEHEKRWHPEIAEPEEHFPAFVKWVKPLIA
jgi:sugar phosphate isomerase/epimerase